jgi:2-keto-4-pentenoate hydratase/2-oxohepta-3-ene-1,7-dioic acid hydratase in catechol pathway
VSQEEALGFVAGIVPVNDVTARDLQRKDSQWSRAKGFDTFCPVGEMVPIEDVDMDNLGVLTRVNGREKQRGTVDQMVFSIPFLISYISRIMTLEPGDLLATGTPEGVGPVSEGDVVEVEISGVGTLTNPVVAR